MTDILLLVSAIAILQVSGAYVRYTPFAGIMDDKTKRCLFYTDCLVLLLQYELADPPLRPVRRQSLHI